MSPPNLSTSNDLLICTACGAQYDVTTSSNKSECRICDDPRQFVPPSGQSFTTMVKLREDGYKNTFRQDTEDPRIWEIWTEPKFAIGQRAILFRTPSGNILWDLISLLDESTVSTITSLGGISAIVISHPHFYSTWADWSATFSCPVYMSHLDAEWANRHDAPGADLRLLTERYTEIILPPPRNFTSPQKEDQQSSLAEPSQTATPPITAIHCGGHFPGSMVLHCAPHLFVADTLLLVPSGLNPSPGNPPSSTSPPFPSGPTSYAFMYSIPNYIPLPPSTILNIWRSIKPFDFTSTWGVFHGSLNRPAGGKNLRPSVLESAKIACRAMGYETHELMREES